MVLRINFFTVAALFFCVNAIKAAPMPPQQVVCGKWESTDKNLIVEIYVQDNKYQARLIWFKDTEGKPMDYWTDIHNPDPELRGRKLLGMSILDNLSYDASSNSWQNGMVYDAHHGRYWNASAYIDDNGQLNVRGYWHFKFIGKTMTFTRV